MGDVPAFATCAQLPGDLTRLRGSGDVVQGDAELLGDVLAVLRDQVLGDDEEHLVTGTVGNRAERIAGGAERLAAALLPAQYEAAALAGLRERAR